jgi:hypothetical protein
MVRTIRAPGLGGVSVVTVLLLTAGIVSGVSVLSGASDPASPDPPARSASAPAGPEVVPPPDRGLAPPPAGGRLSAQLPRPVVAVASAGTYSWALLDRRTQTVYASANGAATDFSESVVKIWLAADHLRRVDAAGGKPPTHRLRLLSVMVRDSHDGAADTMYSVNGREGSIRRMISVCRLTETRVFPEWWSKTLISARDMVRLGQCVADGRAAGPQWTSWLLGEMRNVRGLGDFGIARTIPEPMAASVAVKNGWFLHGFDSHWRINCLAVHEAWALAVMTRYPARHGFAYGGKVCEAVARQALGPVLARPLGQGS